MEDGGDENRVPGAATVLGLQLPLIVEHKDKVGIPDVPQQHPGHIEQSLKDLGGECPLGNQQPGIDLDQHAVRHTPLILGVGVGDEDVEGGDDVVRQNDDWALNTSGEDSDVDQVSQEVEHGGEIEASKAPSSTKVVDVEGVENENSHQVEPVVVDDNCRQAALVGAAGGGVLAF